jgi:hypothetical protein
MDRNDMLLGGIAVAWVRITFHDGTDVTYDDVEYLRQAEGLTLVVEPQRFVFVPWSTVRLLTWVLPPA